MTANYQRKLNMIQGAREGIELARSIMAGPGGQAAMLEALRADFPMDDDCQPMTVARASYLACLFLAWKEAGCPEL